MEPTNQPILRTSLKSGLLTVSAVSENEFPRDGVIESKNFHFDTIGQATLRKGTTLLGTALSGDILGLYQFRDSGAGTNNQIIMVNGTVAYYLSGGSWTSKRTGLTAGSKARFSTFLDYVFMVNGTEATNTWDGNPANAFGTTNCAGTTTAPIGKFIENYRARMWIAGNATFPDRVYYSTLPSAVGTPIIGWDTTVTTGQWIDVSPSDGENITALHRTKNALLVFKNNHLYQIYSISSADADPKFSVGTYSQESIVETKNGVYFHHPTGIYRYNGDVQEVSRPVIDIINAVSLANYSKVCGYLEVDGDHICWQLGNVTYNGVSYTNMVIRYTISTQVWTHYEYPTQHLVSSPYNDGTSLYMLVGDNNGSVLKINTGLTDTGAELSYSVIHQFDDLDGTQNTRKNIQKMFFQHKKMTGANINWQLPTDNAGDWTKGIGQLKDIEVGFKPCIKGSKFSFKISGTSKGQPVIYEGFTIDEFTSELINYG